MATESSTALISALSYAGLLHVKEQKEKQVTAMGRSW